MTLHEALKHSVISAIEDLCSDTSVSARVINESLEQIATLARAKMIVLHVPIPKSQRITKGY